MFSNIPTYLDTIKPYYVKPPEPLTTPALIVLAGLPAQLAAARIYKRVPRTKPPYSTIHHHKIEPPV